MGVEPTAGILALRGTVSIQHVLKRGADGRYAVDEFPDEVHANHDLVQRLDPNLVRLERERLYIHAANGEAVYVPLGDSPLRGCRRYGRLYLRWHGDAA